MGLAFNKLDMSKVSCPYPGSNRWHYRDMTMPLSVMLAPGFFDQLGQAVDPGDFLDISAKNGGATRYIAATTQYTVTLEKVQ